MNRRLLLRAAPVMGLLVFILLVVLGAPQPEPPEPPTPEPTSVPTLTPEQASRQRGQWVQALYWLEAGAAAEGWTVTRYRQAGDLWALLGDVTRALPYWEAAAAQTQEATLLRQLASSYLSMQRWADARRTLDLLLTADPDDLWAAYQAGLLLAPYDPLRARDYLQRAAGSAAYAPAAGLLLDLIGEGPGDPLISMRVGAALMALELWPYAEQAFRYAAEATAPNPEALAYAGLARHQQGKDGEPWIEAALALGPDNPAVHYVSGLHLRARADYAASLQAIITAALLDPLNVSLYSELATSYRLAGDEQRARHWQAVAEQLGAP